MEQERLSE